MQVFGAGGEMAFHEHVAGLVGMLVNSSAEAQNTIKSHGLEHLLLRVVVLALLMK